MIQYRKIKIKETKENAINDILKKIDDLRDDLQEAKDEIEEEKEYVITEEDKKYIDINLRQLTLLQDKLYYIIDEYLKGLEK